MNVCVCVCVCVRPCECAKTHVSVHPQLLPTRPHVGTDMRLRLPGSKVWCPIFEISFLVVQQRYPQLGRSWKMENEL